MRSMLFLSHVLSTPWAMDPAAMAAYAAILGRGYARRLGIDGIEAAAPEAAAPARAAPARQGGIAVVNVFGPIMQRASQFGPCEAGAAAEDIDAALSAAVADETVGQVIMRFDTPGGSVFGIQELGDRIRALRASKPIIGIADSLSASAGYWLLAQCTEAYVTPGGMVGSIGVYSAHEDVSKAMEASGIKVELVSAGRFKVEGNPFEPLSEEARGHMQAQVNHYADVFHKAVAKGRGVPVDQVRAGMGEGRCLQADAALAAGMVDGISTFADLVAKMQRKPAKGRSALAAARNELQILG